MNNLSVVPFYFREDEIRSITDEQGNSLFVAKDVAKALGYIDTVNAIKQHCKGVVKHHPLLTSGGLQDVRIIHEPDLFRLISNSQLPAAQEFERWIFEEVLPQIRKTGSYNMHPAPGYSLISDKELAAIYAGKEDLYIDHINLLKKHIEVLENKVPMRRNFTQEEDMMVIELRSQGMSHREIGLHVGRKTESVRSCLRRLGVQ